MNTKYTTAKPEVFKQDKVIVTGALFYPYHGLLQDVERVILLLSKDISKCTIR